MKPFWFYKKHKNAHNREGFNKNPIFCGHVCKRGGGVKTMSATKIGVFFRRKRCRRFWNVKICFDGFPHVLFWNIFFVIRTFHTRFRLYWYAYKKVIIRKTFFSVSARNPFVIFVGVGGVGVVRSLQTCPPFFFYWCLLFYSVATFLRARIPGIS